MPDEWESVQEEVRAALRKTETYSGCEVDPNGLSLQALYLLDFMEALRAHVDFQADDLSFLELTSRILESMWARGLSLRVESTKHREWHEDRER